MCLFGLTYLVKNHLLDFNKLDCCYILSATLKGMTRLTYLMAVKWNTNIETIDMAEVGEEEVAVASFD